MNDIRTGGPYFRHQTIRQAARLLGLTPDGAKARLYPAMRNLADMLAAGWPADAGPAGSGTGNTRDRPGWIPCPVRSLIHAGSRNE